MATLGSCFDRVATRSEGAASSDMVSLESVRDLVASKFTKIKEEIRIVHQDVKTLDTRLLLLEKKFVLMEKCGFVAT